MAATPARPIQAKETEADLDVEWSGAVARNATIKFVVSKSTNSSDGVDLSAQYIVNHNLAPGDEHELRPVRVRSRVFWKWIPE